jgi:hypothetical protein
MSGPARGRRPDPGYGETLRDLIKIGETSGPGTVANQGRVRAVGRDSGGGEGAETGSERPGTAGQAAGQRGGEGWAAGLDRG